MDFNWVSFRRLLPDNLYIWWIFCSVVSPLSVATPHWRRGISSLIFGLQLEHCHSICFGSVCVGPDSVLPVFCSWGVVYWLNWLKVAFLSRVVCFLTRLTWWVNNFCGSFTVFIAIVHVIFVVVIDSRDRFFSATVFDSGDDFEWLQPAFCVYSGSVIGFGNVQFFFSGGTLVSVCRPSRLQYVCSQCSLVARQELPNYSALISFPDVWQSVRMRHSPNARLLLLKVRWHFGI